MEFAKLVGNGRAVLEAMEADQREQSDYVSRGAEPASLKKNSFMKDCIVTYLFRGWDLNSGAATSPDQCGSKSESESEWDDASTGSDDSRSGTEYSQSDRESDRDEPLNKPSGEVEEETQPWRRRCKLTYNILQQKTISHGDAEGHLTRVFWADARSRAAYKYFGDVVSFDTTYLMNKYGMSFSPFVGVNQHGQTLLLGCALLSDETTESYTWLLETWVTCMDDVAPIGQSHAREHILPIAKQPLNQSLPRPSTVTWRMGMHRSMRSHQNQQSKTQKREKPLDDPGLSGSNRNTTHPPHVPTHPDHVSSRAAKTLPYRHSSLELSTTQMKAPIKSLMEPHSSCEITLQEGPPYRKYLIAIFYILWTRSHAFSGIPTTDYDAQLQNQEFHICVRGRPSNQILYY